MDRKEISKILISLLGSKDNIVNVFNCYTRVRANVKDINLVDQEKIKETSDVIGLVIDAKPSTNNCWAWKSR